MTLVTGAPTFGRLLAAGLLLAGCSETTAPSVSAPATVAAPQIELPPPAPLPPPPKPVLPPRAPTKPATAKLAGNGAEAATEATAASSNEDTGKSQAAERAAESTPVQAEPPPTPAEPPTPADAAIARGAALALAARPPIRLIGLSRTSTAALLGAPSDERQIAAARVWDYRGPECRLAVYFYLDTGRNDFYALHYEIDGPPPGPDADQHCLQRIRDDARNR